MIFNRTRYLTQGVAKFLIWMAALSTIAVMILILFQILKEGLPVLNFQFFLDSPKEMGREGGIFSTIIGTAALTAVAIIAGAPLGVGTAIFLREYTRESRISRVIRFGTDCLAGVPSIIFGLFGFVFFVIRLNMGWSILSGGLTLAAMILPTVISTAEESIRGNPLFLPRGKLFFRGDAMANGHPCRASQCITRNLYRDPAQCRQEYRRNRCHHSNGRLLFGDAHFSLLPYPNDVCPFLYSCQRRHFHENGLRDRGGFDFARSDD